MRRLYNIIKKMDKNSILKLATARCEDGRYALELRGEPVIDKPINERIGFFDIEASNLKATFGYMFCYCIKELDGKIIANSVTQKEILNYDFDKRLMKELCADLRKFDRIVVQYGSDYKFDLPFVRTRAVHYGLDFPLYKEINVTDTHSILKAKFKLHSNRLETACQFFDIEAKGHKLEPVIWNKALAGDPKSLDYILTHCKEDVVSLEEVYKRICDYVAEGKRSI